MHAIHEMVLVNDMVYGRESEKHLCLHLLLSCFTAPNGDNGILM